MTWNPIIVGVDGSQESVRAAAMGCAVAKAAGTECHLVHAVPDYWGATWMPEVAGDPAELNEALRGHARTLLVSALEGSVPSQLLRNLDVRVGRAPIVLAQVAAERGAGLVVLGGKHHKGLGRLGSRTLQHMVRTSDVPLLATDGTSGTVERVLVAVDLSYAARPAIEAGERFAKLFDAQLRIMHAVEPVPVIPGFPLDLGDDDCYRSVERLLEMTVWPLVQAPAAERVVRRGRAAAAIVSEVAQWRADLVIVGSHGKGWVDRLLIGSTSERLLHLLPTLTLIIPVARPSDAGPLPAIAPPPSAGTAR
jgi:nucleotide-binding universal stress UspA family protein